MSEADPDARTVADVLEEVPWGEDAGAMYDMITGSRDPDTLAYEDWVRPLKLTGGRVCLKVRNGMFRWWYLWDPDGLKRVTGTEGVLKDTPPESVQKAKDDITTRHTTITPVLRADTPFAEADP